MPLFPKVVYSIIPYLSFAAPAAFSEKIIKQKFAPVNGEKARKPPRLCYNRDMDVFNARKKGKSLMLFPEDYTVVDIETTGLYSGESEIIEISALRYRSRRLTDSFSTLVRPQNPVSAFITELTGITDEMARGGAEPEQALSAFRKFAGGDIIVGYNVNFDVNFLYDALYSRLGEIFDNDFVDVLRFARRLLPALSNHRQTTVAGFFGIDVAGAHRAEKDCLICAACLERLRAMADEKKIQF